MKQNRSRYSKLIIYYFSGTGNAKNASIWISNVAKAQGLDCQLINIDKFKSIELPDIDGKCLIGFCSPTHGFNLPPIALRFICKFPKIKNADVFLLNTRGGLKLSKLFIPGLSGVTQILPALILKAKGYKVVGMQPLDLPSNWLILHPGLREKVIDSIYTRCHKIVDQFALHIISGGKRYKALWSLPIDLILIPIAIAYYFIGRFFLAKTLIATNTCNHCNLCIEQCPVEAISLVNDRLFWSYKCESCMRCVNQCKQRSIQTIHSFAALVILASSLVISPALIALFKFFGLWDFISQSSLSQGLWSVIDAFVFVLFTFLSYRVLHFLLRYKCVNLAIAYTSLSFYKFWRRYKAPC